MAEPHRTDNHRTALDLHGDKIVGGHPSNRQAEQNPSTGRPEEVRGRRIQLSRKKGWRKPEGAVVVSRPGKSGKDLCCWCADGTACHADVLLVLSNGGAK